MRPKFHQYCKIIIGNQIMIMRALEQLVSPYMEEALKVRVYDQKAWWKGHFDEEVGFSSSLGDRPDA